MHMTARGPFQDQDSKTAKWVVIFVLLSLLVHVIAIAVILLITIFMPVPKIVPVKVQSNDVTLSLQPPPPVPVPKNDPAVRVVTTTPDALAKPNPKAAYESANDHRLTSTQPNARAPESLLPDTQGVKNGDMNNLKPHEGKTAQEVSSTPPTPKPMEQQKAEPLQPRPPQPPQPRPVPQNPKPPTPQTPPKPEPVVDDNGLPVLPPISAPTMAPANSAAPSMARKTPQETADDRRGAVSEKGVDNSPAARATALGRYQQKVSLAIRSRWQQKLGSSAQLIGVGQIVIQYTIHADGTVETEVIDAGDASTQLLLSVSLNAIREAAPYDKFDTYPGLKEEIMRKFGSDGTSYPVVATFTMY